MNRIVAAVIVLAGLVAVQAVTAATVDAHAVLESATPANGAMLTAPPDQVELVFSENVGEPAALVVLDGAGDEVEGGELSIVDDTMSRAYAAEGFTPGTYTVSYQVTSADGHPIAGSLSFMVHGDGSEVVAATGVDNGTSGDADPLTVALLACAVALALGIAVVLTKRLIAQPDTAG